MNYQQEMNFAKKFMAGLATDFVDDKKAFIMVAHINPTSIPLINTLAKHGRLAGIIAKPNSVHIPTYEVLHDRVKLLDISKQELFMPSVINDKIAPLVRKDEKLIIVDIGGYFAGALKSLNALPNLAGIVEDTENGLQKYENILKTYPDNKIPVISVARSRAKKFEDYLIGRSIVMSSIDALLISKRIYKNKKIGVIGFGEVGRGGAFYLKDKLKLNVSIYDSNPKVRELAQYSGFGVSSRDKILAESDILFCMTGNKSLQDTDIQMLKPGCLVASCTSSDDEFGFKDFDIIAGEKQGNIRNTAGINFINNGNAVNFMRPETLESRLSPYIYLTHSVLLDAVVNMDKNAKQLPTTEITSLAPEREKEIISSFRESLHNSNRNNRFINDMISKKFGSIYK